MILTRALPRTITQIRPMTLGLHLVEQKRMLTKHKYRSRYISSSEEDQSSVLRHRSPKPSRKAHSDLVQPQHDPDPSYYREVALSDIPSQYTEEVDTFRRILKLPDPRESMVRSSTAVMGIDDEKGRQELRPSPQASSLFAPTIEGVGHPLKGRQNLQNLGQFSLGKISGPYVVTKITVFETSQGKGKRVSPIS